MVVDVSKIGAARAEEVIDSFADGVHGLTGSECQKMGFDDGSSRLLREVLTPGRGGLVTSGDTGSIEDEKGRLVSYGFARDFVTALVGDDGANALRRRVNWLADKSVTSMWRRDDPEVQSHCIQELADIGEYAVAAVPYLIEVLEDCESSWSIVRFCRGCENDFLTSAARALGNIGPKAHPAIPALKRALQRWPAPKKEAALIALAQIGPAKEVLQEILHYGLEDENSPAVREAGIRAVGILGYEGRTLSSFLVKIVGDEKEEVTVRREAALSLGRVITEEVSISMKETVIGALIGGLGEVDVRIREAAAVSLLSIGEFSLPYLIEVIGDKKTSQAIHIGTMGVLGDLVLNLALEKLERHRDLLVREAIPQLIRFLQSGDPLSIDSAMQALAKIARREKAATLAALAAVIRDRIYHTESEHAAKTIQEITIRAEEGDDETLKLLVAEALPALCDVLIQEEMRGPFLAQVAMTLEAMARRIKDEAPDLMVQFKEQACPALAKAIEVGNTDIRDLFGKALVTIGAPSVGKLVRLLQVLPESDIPFISSLLITIGSNENESLPELVEALKIEPVAQAMVGILCEINIVAVPELIRALDSWTHVSGREAAARAIGCMGPDAAAASGSLIKLLDGPPSLREEAVTALTRVGPRAILPLVSKMEEGRSISRDVLSRVALILGRLAESVKRDAPDLHGVLIDRGVNALMAALGFPRPVPKEAKRALVSIGKFTSTQITRGLQDEGIRKEFIDVVVEIGRPLATTVIPLILHAEPKVSSGAADILIGIGPSIVPDLFRTAEKTTDKDHLITLIDILSRIDFSDVKDLVFYMREDDETQVSRVAAQVLILLGIKAVEELVKTLLDKERKPTLRGRVARILGKIGKNVQRGDVALTEVLDARVIPSLIDVWKGEKEPDHLHDACSKALVDIGYPALFPLAEYFEGSKKNTALRVETLEMLGIMGQQIKDHPSIDRDVFVDRVVPLLIAALREDEGDLVRDKAQSVLANLGMASFEKFLTALAKEGEFVRARSEKILASMFKADKKAHPQFVRALGRDSEGVQQVMTAILDHADPADPSVLDDLLALTRSYHHQRVQLRAIHEIARMKGISNIAIPTLRRRLEETTDGEVKRALEEAIARLSTGD